MNRLLVSISMILLAAVVAGCIFSSNDDKEVKKGTVSGTVTMTVTNTPLANVKVMLVNANAKADTVNYANNYKAFVDSTLTDSEGKYVFSSVSPGKYGVVALNADTTKTYKYTLAANSPDYQFSLNGESRTVNFIAEEMAVPGASSDVFTIVVYMKNINYTTFPNADLASVVCRREWYLGVPVMQYPLSYTEEVIDASTRRVLMQFKYGYTALFYTLDNCFSYQPDGIIGRLEFFIYFPLSSTPAHSTFEYDYATNTVTRTE